MTRNRAVSRIALLLGGCLLALAGGCHAARQDCLRFGVATHARVEREPRLLLTPGAILFRSLHQGASVWIDAPAWNGNELAYSTRAALRILSADGSITHEIDTLNQPSQPVALSNGNFAAAFRKFFVVSPAGEVLWASDFGANVAPGVIDGATFTSRPLVSPEGIAYVAASDGYLTVFDALGYEKLYRIQLPEEVRTFNYRPPDVRLLAAGYVLRAHVEAPQGPDLAPRA